jgi:hypothetical protein
MTTPLYTIGTLCCRQCRRLARDRDQADGDVPLASSRICSIRSASSSSDSSPAAMMAFSAWSMARMISSSLRWTAAASKFCVF